MSLVHFVSWIKQRSCCSCFSLFLRILCFLGLLRPLIFQVITFIFKHVGESGERVYWSYPSLSVALPSPVVRHCLISYIFSFSSIWVMVTIFPHWISLLGFLSPCVCVFFLWIWLPLVGETGTGCGQVALLVRCWLLAFSIVLICAEGLSLPFPPSIWDEGILYRLHSRSSLHYPLHLAW